jgi:hypothetical protein
MEPLTDKQIREAICNCSRGERNRLNLPDLTSLAWEDLDVLGWRDPKAPQRGYLVTPTEEGPVGVMVRAPETRVRRMAQCLLCQTVHQDNVSLMVAPKAGSRGNSIGTYVCTDLGCSAHLRASLRPTRQLPDPTPVIAARGEELRARLRGFIASVQRES